MIKVLWKDPVWGAVIAAGIIGAVGLASTYVLDLWPVIAAYLMDVFTFMRKSSPLPNWLLVILVIATIPSFIIVVALILQAIRSPDHQTPTWESYTSDTFFNLRWRWRYDDGEISRLNSFCPRCDFQVFPVNASAFRAVDRIAFKCDSCHANLTEIDDSYELFANKVRRFIQQKIRNDSWRVSDKS